MKSAVILAGGKGTRMKSDKPKVLHKILDEPMARLIVHSLKKAGAERIITIAGYHYEEVEEALAGECEFAVQEPQLGTGHAVMQAHQLENETGWTLVVNGDGPCVRPETYAKMYEMLNHADMAVLTSIPDDNAAYGRIVRNEDGTVKKIVEFKDADEEERKIREINTGIYAFQTELLFEGLKHLKNDNAQHEYYITDLVEIFHEMGKTVGAVVCEDWREAEGVNDCIELSRAEKYMQKRINEEWMRNGVTMIDPESVYIGPDVVIGHDVIIHPGVSLYGSVKVEDGVEIMPGYYAKDTIIHKNEKTVPFSYRTK